MITETMGADLAGRLRTAEEAVSSAYGPFVLFVLAEREEAPGRWDLLVSAPWLTIGRRGVELMVDALKPYLTPEDWLQLASITPLALAMDYVQWIARKYDVRHDSLEVVNVFWNGLFIPHGFVITARLVSAASGTPPLVAA